ncbi:MAG TPA: hypothetical protein VHP32_12080 [Ignavibacteria bacterium]|nr:hypothetical protein [Ignavibacteria bacterium]
MSEIKLSDKDFLEAFIKNNLEYKKIINDILFESSKKYSDIESIKSIVIQLIEIYVIITETVLMVLYAIRKYQYNGKSFLSIYKSIKISESENSKMSTEKILETIMNLNVEDFIKYFNLPSYDEFYSSVSKEKQNEAKQLFGNEEEIKTQLYIEYSNLKKTLEALAQNRIKIGDTDIIPFYRMYNKLKHGMQIYTEKDKDNIGFIDEVNSVDSITSKITIDFILFQNKHILYYHNQINNMIFSLKHLISLIIWRLN